MGKRYFTVLLIAITTKVHGSCLSEGIKQAQEVLGKPCDMECVKSLEDYGCTIKTTDSEEEMDETQKQASLEEGERTESNERLGDIDSDLQMIHLDLQRR